MKCPERSADEAGRLRALAEYGLDERVGLPSLDPIVDMAARLFGCPTAAVNMIGDDHVFLASSTGVGECDMSRDVSFCAHAINQDDVMVIEDAALDVRFHDNPLVEAGMIRFYAGVALRSPSGHALGALCVIDSKPHASFPLQERFRLKEMSKLVSDKLELRRLEAAEAKPFHRFEASAETSPNAIICFDESRCVTALNPAASTMFGRSENDMIGETVDTLVSQDNHALIHAAIDRVRSGGEPKKTGTALIGLRSNGDHFPAELHWSHWYENRKIYFGAIVRDMTEHRREHDALYHLANYDSLTGLPNRNMLSQRLTEATAAQRPIALVVIDLDGFTDVNNTLGHEAGDSVLIDLAQRIRAIAPEMMVARIGGDEYAVLVEQADVISIDTIARRIIETIGEPFVIDGHEIRISGNCGIAIGPDHGKTVEELVSSAELALFQARQNGRGSTYLFTPALRAEAVARRMYDAELHRAFERDEFVLFYQPQFALDDGAMVGAEALIRWNHPLRGLLAPAAFLPALEAGVLAAPVGQWVLETACAQAIAWRDLAPDFRVSVNLFPAQFRSGDLPRQVAETLDKYGLPPSGLELEITENIILTEQGRILAQLEEVARLGVTLSFDDFGTGFASLNLLRSFPVSCIKIDKSFIQLMRTSEKDRVIVVGTIDMAQKLGLKVVAEGIEDAEDRDFLRLHRCDTGQGYFFGKPVPAAVFAERFLHQAFVRREHGGLAAL